MANPLAAAIVAAEKFLSYFWWIIIGIIVKPTAAAVAGPEPDTAPQKRQVRTPAIAKPPVALPTIIVVKWEIFSASFAFCIRIPARTKKGIAIKGNLAIPEAKFLEIIVTPRPYFHIENTAANPTDVPMGTPIKRRRAKIPKRVKICIIFPPLLQFFLIQFLILYKYF